MTIQGNRITLVPALLADRRDVYNWCFHSETTKSHIGPPDYPDMEIPTYEEFCEDYTDYYFDGTRPADGRGYIIQASRQPVGFLSYCSFHLKPHYSELDIWMNSEANCGKGYGTDAIAALVPYLAENLGIRWAIMRPSCKNTRAVASYKKVGFVQSDMMPQEYMRPEYIEAYGDGDYGEGGDALLVWGI